MLKKAGIQAFAILLLCCGYSLAVPFYGNQFADDTEFVPLEQQARTEGPSKSGKPFDIDVISTDVGGGQAGPGLFFQQSFPFFGQDFFNSFGGFGIGGGPVAEQPWWKGPNVCTEKSEEEKDMKDVKENDETEAVEGTDFRPPLLAQFHFSVNSCVEKPNKYVCTKIFNENGKKRTLTITRQCCQGYGRSRNAEYGATCEKIEIKTLDAAALEMGTTDFITSAKSSGLSDVTNKDEKVTLFMPVDEAFKKYNDQQRSETNLVDAKTDEAMKKLIERHTVEGEVSLYDVSNEDTLKTLDGETIRMNTYQIPLTLSPEPVLYTANCIPVGRHDILIKEGIAHTVDGVLKPVNKNVMDIIRGRSDLSIMRTVLEKTKLNELLEGEKPVTIFVPTDAAFDKLEPHLRRALKEGKGCASNILKNHILDLTFCSVASVPGAKTTAYNLLGEVMLFNRTTIHNPETEASHMVGRAKVETPEIEEQAVIINGIAKMTETDIMGTNGVVHIIDTILPTAAALPITSLMKEKNVTLFRQLVEAAGFDEKFDDLNNVTIFAPTDKALNHSKWVQLLKESPEKLRNDAELKDLINYHVISPMIKTCDLTEKLFPTENGQKVRINLFSTHSLFSNVMNRATVNCARLVHFDDESCGSVLHQVDKVLEPPKMNLLQMLESNPNYGKFLQLVRKANLTEILANLDEGYTLLVPKDDVFGEDDDWEETLAKDKQELDNLIKTHIVNDVVCCAGIIPTNWPFVRSIEALNGSHLRITRDRRPKVENAGITKCDAIAKNGIIHEINDIIVPKRQTRRPQHNYQADLDKLDSLFF